ncbi:MAG: hypothetical protein KDA24_10205 [Deltaproteobacteria bacterium]|nr:hypothetical protein [Deltaproteobacteria bacterium]
MFHPRSIPPWSPPLDRLVIRAALARGAAWPRTAEGLAAAVATAVGREDTPAQWVASPETALLRALDARFPDAVLAAPAWGRTSFAAPLEGRDVVWMEPARLRLDPGASEVAAAIDAGATAVLLSPVAGDCTSLLGVDDLCERRGVALVVDARAASGGRVLDGSPASLGTLTLASVDGEPGPAPCPGAVLLGADAATNEPPGPGPSPSWSLAARLLADSLQFEPRVRRLWDPPRADRLLSRSAGPAPGWAFAAAAARLQQSAARASQRARHSRTLSSLVRHIQGVALPTDPTGVQSAGGAIGLRIAHRDAVRSALSVAGVSPVPPGGWLAPDGRRGPRATEVQETALLLPLLPFYLPRDLDFIGEALRRAALRSVPDVR